MLANYCRHYRKLVKLTSAFSPSSFVRYAGTVGRATIGTRTLRIAASQSFYRSIAVQLWWTAGRISRWMAAFPHCEFILMLQKNPEGQPVGD
jgi:hypothetical protein